MAETLRGATASASIVLPQNSAPGRRPIAPATYDLFAAVGDLWPRENAARTEMPPLADLMKHVVTVQRSSAHVESPSGTERWVWTSLALAGIGCGMFAGASFAGSDVVDPLTSLLLVLGVCALVVTVRHWGWQRERT